MSSKDSEKSSQIPFTKKLRNKVFGISFTKKKNINKKELEIDETISSFTRSCEISSIENNSIMSHYNHFPSSSPDTPTTSPLEDKMSQLCLEKHNNNEYLRCSKLLNNNDSGEIIILKSIDEKLPKIPNNDTNGFKPLKGKKKVLNNDFCTICKELLKTKSNGERIIELECGHQCHQECMLVSFDDISNSMILDYNQLFPICVDCQNNNSLDNGNKHITRCIPRNDEYKDDIIRKLLAIQSEERREITYPVREFSPLPTPVLTFHGGNIKPQILEIPEPSYLSNPRDLPLNDDSLLSPNSSITSEDNNIIRTPDQYDLNITPDFLNDSFSIISHSEEEETIVPQVLEVETKPQQVSFSNNITEHVLDFDLRKDEQFSMANLNKISNKKKDKKRSSFNLDLNQVDAINEVHTPSMDTQENENKTPRILEQKFGYVIDNSIYKEVF